MSRADLRIDERDLADVGAPRVARLERLGRIVRRVRVVEVDPAEEALVLDLVEPGERLVGDLVARPIDAAERERLVLAEIEVVEVGLEPLRDAPLVVEHVGADESAGVEAARLEPLGQRRLAVVEEEAAVVAHAVRGRILAGEDRRVRRERERRRRDRLLEEHALARHAIDGRRLDAVVPVRVDVIGARRVERDEQEVQPGRRDAGRQAPERVAARGGHRARRPAPPGRPAREDGQRRQRGDGEHSPSGPAGGPGPRGRVRPGRRRHGTGSRLLPPRHLDIRSSACRASASDGSPSSAR